MFFSKEIYKAQDVLFKLHVVAFNRNSNRVVY